MITIHVIFLNDQNTAVLERETANTGNMQPLLANGSEYAGVGQFQQ